MSFGLSANIFAKDFVVAISPFQDTQYAVSHTKTLLKRLAQDLEPGDRLTFLDGWHVRMIGTLNMPEKAIYNSAKARIKMNKRDVQKIMAFAKNAPHPAQGVEPKSAVLRTPDLMRYISQNFASEEPVEILLLGSPLFADPNNQAFSMQDGLVFGDGHLVHGRDQSVFGIAGQDDDLKNMRLHWVYDGDAVYQNSRHEHFVQRAWTLWFEGQSGAVVSFGDDIDTALDRSLNNAAPIPHNYKRQPTERLEMIRIPQIELKESIFERPVSTAPLRKNQLQNIAKATIGITWSGDVDLDLYVRAHAKADLLYFENSQTNEGIYFKDFLSSPAVTNGLETVELKNLKDLNELQIAINFYSGIASQGVRGEIRMAIGAQTYAMPFNFPAGNGDAGQHVRQQMSAKKSVTAQTILINPLDILKIKS